MRRFLLLTLLALVGVVPSASATDIVWDTISTGRVRLVVSNVGQIGRMGSLDNGGVNMDYAGLGHDCNTTARVYLFDGGPFVMRQDSAGYYTWGTSLYQSAGTTHGFVPLGDIPSQHFTGPNYNGFRTGTFVTTDSSIGMRVSFYAPTDLRHLLHCAFGADSTSFDFVIGKYEVFSRSTDTMRHVTVGFLNDWDVPSSAPKINSAQEVSYYSPQYLTGVDSVLPSCIPNTHRIASSSVLGFTTTLWNQADQCSIFRQISADQCEVVDSLTSYSAGGDSTLADFLWRRSLQHLRPLPSHVGDYFQLSAVIADSNIYRRDTLIVFVTYMVGQNGTADTLKDTYWLANSWSTEYVRKSVCRPGVCCWRSTGNIDMDPMDGVDISDLSELLGYLYIDFQPLTCQTTANTDGDPGGGVDISDLARLIDYLYINFTPLACCQN